MRPSNRQLIVRIAVAAALVAINGCSAATAPAATESQGSPSTQPGPEHPSASIGPTSPGATEPAPPEPTGAQPPSTLDLAKVPLAFFAPLPPNTPHMGYGGSNDYFELFAPSAPWTEAERRIDVFSIPASWVQNYASDEQLKTVIDGAAARGLALGLEIGPYTGEPCGAGIEGNDLNDYPFNRIHALGGRVDVVSWDEPMAFATRFDAPTACRWTFEQAAAGIATATDRVRELEPAALIGDIEPIWANIAPEEYGAWLDSYEAAVGQAPAFLHIDVDWDNVASWPRVVRNIEDDARSRGVRFGLIYNGGFVDSDSEWANLSMQRAAIYEERSGGRLDDVVFGSWMDHPDRVLPESDPTTFTGLIDRYFGARTSIDVADLVAAADGLHATISLVQADGSPVSNTPLSLSLVPLDGTPQELVLDGVVPDGVHVAVAGIRVNTEGAGPGEADLRIYEVEYTQGGGGNLLGNPRFANDLNDWYVYGDGHVTTPASDAGVGRMLRIMAGPNEPTLIDHMNMEVEPGSEFRLRVSAAVPELSAGSAYAAVMFQLGDKELERQLLPLAPAPIVVGVLSTNAGGLLALNAASGLAAGRYRLVVDYPGDATHWPSTASAEVAVP